MAAPQHGHAVTTVSEQQLLIHKELTAVAYAHAPAFVDAANSVATAEAATAECRATATALHSHLGDLRAAAHALQAGGAAWRRQRQLAAAASASMSRVTELLDAPQTVEACIRGGMFYEALTAAQHVRGLHARFPGVPLLASVLDQVNDTIERLLTTFVLAQLSGPLVPSNALKIVMFLQSLGSQQQSAVAAAAAAAAASATAASSSSSSAADGSCAPAAACAMSPIASDPAALPELFLALRSEFIAGAMKEALALSGGSSFACLQRTLAVYKVHVSESVATFKACFVEAAPASTNSEHQPPQHLQNHHHRDAEARSDLLRRWATEHTARLLGLFTALVANLTSGADLALLLEPVVQCGSALARVGLDVSVALEGVLLCRAEVLFTQGMSQAAASFVAALGAHRWRPVLDSAAAAAPTSTQQQPPAAGTDQGGDAATATATQQQQQQPTAPQSEAERDEQQRLRFVPPMSLLRFPPLAHAMNSFLTGCNDVRKCALRAVRPRCMRAVADLVAAIAAQLARVRGALLLEGAELEALRHMVRAFAEEFVPHVRRCTGRVFGECDATDEDRAWKRSIAQSVASAQAATLS